MHKHTQQIISLPISNSQCENPEVSGRPLEQFGVYLSFSNQQQESL